MGAIQKVNGSEIDLESHTIKGKKLAETHLATMGAKRIASEDREKEGGDTGVANKHLHKQTETAIRGVQIAGDIETEKIENCTERETVERGEDNNTADKEKTPSPAQQTLRSNK